jgi:hypothetical protein
MSMTVTVTKSSVHDFDSGGIRCNCPTGMTVDINSNSVVGSNSANSNSPDEGIDMDAAGKISNNSVPSNPALPATSQGVGIAFKSNMVVSGNTVIGWGADIWTVGDSNVIKLNRVSKAGGGITLSGNNNDVEHNFLANFPGGAGISFNCTGSGNTVIHNQVNDAYWGIVDPHGTNTVTPNTFTNVQVLGFAALLGGSTERGNPWRPEFGRRLSRHEPELRAAKRLLSSVVVVVVKSPLHSLTRSECRQRAPYACGRVLI